MRRVKDDIGLINNLSKQSLTLNNYINIENVFYASNLDY